MLDAFLKLLMPTRKRWRGDYYGLIIIGLLQLAATAPLQAQTFITPEPHPDWTVTKNWLYEEGVYVFEAKSTAVIEQCRAKPTFYLAFPFSIEGTQRVVLDRTVVSDHGTPDLQQSRSYFGSPILRCTLLTEGHELTWQVFSEAKTFARLRAFGQLHATRPWHNVINETLNIVAAGALPFIAVLCFIIFHKKINWQQNYSLAFSCVFHAVYFLSLVSEFFNLTLPMLTLHKIGDISLWIGGMLFINCLRLSGFVAGSIFLGITIILLISSTVILLSQDIDSAQTGTRIAFIAVMFVFSAVLLSEVRKIWRSGLTLYTFCTVSSLGLYTFTVFHDILTAEGYLDNYMFYSLGVLAGILFYALYLQVQIAQTYAERDYLRQHLESEVNRKTTELNELYKQVRHQSLHDPLTGLPNRLLLNDRLKKAICRAARDHHKFAVVFIDLDKFKEINDSQGHHAGDYLLKEIATRIANLVGKEDTVARVGGDEFTAILNDIGHTDGISGVVHKIQTEIQRPVHFEGNTFVTSASIGVSIYPEDGIKPEILITKADIAMYKAKREQAIE